MTVTLTHEVLADLRKHATHIYEAHSIVAQCFVGQVTPSAFMQINPRAMLALLDRVEALERRERIGAQMANLCYNASQLDGIGPNVRESMTRLYQEWDSAR
jgi:hypothetical protein